MNPLRDRCPAPGHSFPGACSGGIAIILAQLVGFNRVLMLACRVYLVAGVSLTRLIDATSAKRPGPIPSR